MWFRSSMFRSNQVWNSWSSQETTDLWCEEHTIFISLWWDHQFPSKESNIMGMWSFGPKGLIVLSIHAVDSYLSGIALLSIWLRIKWNSWTLIRISCFIFGWIDPMLTCPLRKNLHRRCLKRTHPYSSWYHVHLIHFTLHFRRGLSSLFRDRFHKQHETVKVLENFLRRKGLLM